MDSSALKHLMLMNMNITRYEIFHVLSILEMLDADV